jgi:hypothetical protein
MLVQRFAGDNAGGRLRIIVCSERYFLQYEQERSHIVIQSSVRLRERIKLAGRSSQWKRRADGIAELQRKHEILVCKPTGK